MMKFFGLIGLALLVSLLGCNTHNPEEIKMEKYADAYCECIGGTKLAELNEKARKAIEASEPLSQVEETFKQIEAEHSAARDCCRRLQRKYGNLKTEDIPTFRLKVQGKCSEYAKKEEVMKEMLQY